MTGFWCCNITALHFTKIYCKLLYLFSVTFLQLCEINCRKPNFWISVQREWTQLSTTIYSLSEANSGHRMRRKVIEILILCVGANVRGCRGGVHLISVIQNLIRCSAVSQCALREFLRVSSLSAHQMPTLRLRWLTSGLVTPLSPWKWQLMVPDWISMIWWVRQWGRKPSNPAQVRIHYNQTNRKGAKNEQQDFIPFFVIMLQLFSA